jgi:hypothetical protein
MGCGGAIATFSYSTWVAAFPELATVPEGQATSLYFPMACVSLRNDGTGPVSDPAVQLLLLNLLTAFYAELYTQSQGDQSPGSAKDANSPVGRIDSASEGSVSVHTDIGSSVSEQMAFYAQNKYGLNFWALTAVYRRARYVPGALQAGGSYAGAWSGLNGLGSGFLGGFR